MVLHRPTVEAASASEHSCLPALTQTVLQWYSGTLFSHSSVFLLAVPGSEAIKQEADENEQELKWDCKKVRLLLTDKCSTYSTVIYNCSFPSTVEHVKVQALQSSRDSVSILLLLLIDTSLNKGQNYP